jgi:hypothetical protein
MKKRRGNACPSKRGNEGIKMGMQRVDRAVNKIQNRDPEPNV